MANRETDRELRIRICLHSHNLQDLFKESHKIHLQALEAKSVSKHVQMISRMIDLQREAIKEGKRGIELERILWKFKGKMKGKLLPFKKPI